ncbi:hypothetical protein ACIBW9_18800 [Streptomyces sp. NPDC049541]|uniref:hypothetical protein n=1 Tax=Streptomyces sp. NPDC049541 TaxID=3365594 RepID=UPI0037BCE1E1
MRPDLRLEVLPAPPVLPHASASADVVLLFTVLTRVPDAAAPGPLVAELVRVLTGRPAVRQRSAPAGRRTQPGPLHTPAGPAHRTGCSPPTTAPSAGIPLLTRNP